MLFGQDKFDEEERIVKTQISNTFKPTFAAAAALARRKVALALCVALCTVDLAFPQSGDDATIITFDVLGAVNGTFASSINGAPASPPVSVRSVGPRSSMPRDSLMASLAFSSTL